MIKINLHDTDIRLKIVIIGPERSGKTAVITYLALNIKKRFRSPLVSWANPVGRTTFFDHLLIRFGMAGKKRVVVDLFTVPGSQALLGRRKKVLTCADGIIFTLDSSKDGKVHNLKAAAEFLSLLSAEDIRHSRIPMVYLYHKDDLKNRASLALFKKLLRLSRAPEIRGSAFEGYGIWETLTASVGVVLSAKKIKLTRAFAIREEIPVTIKEFEEVYRTFYLRKAFVEFDNDLSLGRKIIRIDPSTEGFFSLLSEAFERRGDHEKANKYRHRAVRRRMHDDGRITIKISDTELKNPINRIERSRYLSAAFHFIQKKEYEKAQRSIRAAAGGAIDSTDHLMLMKKLAEIKMAAGKYEEALNSFSRLANRFASAGRYREALSLFYRVLSARPKSLECLLGSGNALEAMGRFTDALAYFKKAQKVMSDGKIIVGRSDVAGKILFLVEKIEQAQRVSDGA